MSIKPALNRVDYKVMRVKIRRGPDFEVRPNAEQLEGKTYIFRYGFTFSKSERYPGEVAWIGSDRNYPADAPWWVASGDLEPAEMGDEFGVRLLR